MAANYIPCNQQQEMVRKAIRGLQMLREGKECIEIALAGFGAMKDGDGSQASQFSQMASICSITAGQYADANTAAKKLYDEMNSVNGNVNVASAVQLAGYMGV